MDTLLYGVDWLAVAVGAVLAFALGMFWFGPIFGKAWAAGSHGIKPPERMPMAAIGVQLLGTVLMAWALGVVIALGAVAAGVVFVLAFGLLHLAGGLFSQKSPRASVIDGSYVLAMGALMLLAHAVL